MTAIVGRAPASQSLRLRADRQQMAQVPLIGRRSRMAAVHPLPAISADMNESLLSGLAQTSSND
jgi:hypothetical protein